MTDNSKPAIYRDPFTADDPRANRRGRKTGSRAKLGKRFFEDTYAAWEEQGESALARAAFHDPMGFVSMVARLMPQKLEVSTPTDGMSDERLAQMLDLAEHMARLRSQGVAILPSDAPATVLLARELADENAVTLDQAEEGGGGPLGSAVVRGVSSPHPITAAPAAPAAPAEAPVAEHNVLEGDKAATDPYSQNATALPYPVGRPFPKPDHVVERENRRAGAAVEDDSIDPASLF